MIQFPPIDEDWSELKIKLQAIHNQLYEDETISIPAVLQEILVYGEDHRFFQHRGMDIRALFRATYRTLVGDPQGGSTIAQQLARVVTGRYERTISRKVREIRLALRITNTFPKKEIPALYLVVAYFGWRMNGLAQAYQRLQLSAEELTDEQAASLIARLKYPEPCMASEKRVMQISNRKAHILNFRSKQRLTKFADYFSQIN